MQCTIMGHPIHSDAVRKAYDLFDHNGIIIASPRKTDIESMDAYIQLDLEEKEISEPGQLSQRGMRLLDVLLKSIRCSDFVYVVNPYNNFDSRQNFAAGYAHALGKYIFSSCRVEDSPCGAYVKIFSPREALDFLRQRHDF